MSAETLHPTYFEMGDTVQVRHLADSPHMVVKKKFFEGDEEKQATGYGRGHRSQRKLERVLCYWFNMHDEYCEKDFDYKDLTVVARARTGVQAPAALATA